jgi:hypothetical protein
MPMNFKAVMGGKPYGTQGPLPGQGSLPGQTPKPPDPLTGEEGAASKLDMGTGFMTALANTPMGKRVHQYQDESDRTQAAVDEFQKSSQELGKEFQGAKGSPEDVSRLYEEQRQPIESNFFDSANQVSSYLARQGLGSSGMNLGAHAQLENNRSAMESQARKLAVDEAIRKEREGAMGKFQMEMGGLQPELQKFGIDTSRVIAQMQMQMQMDALQQQMEMGGLGGLGNLLGYGMGPGFLKGLGGGGAGGGVTGGGMGPGVPALEDLAIAGA